ncbi:MAG: hypothetical protein WCG77_12025, partial [Actinomycetes bacterium]
MGLTMAVIGGAITEFSKSKSVSARSCLLFVLCIASYYWTLLHSTRVSTGVAFEAIDALQLRLVDKLRHSRFREFQQLDRGVVYAQLTGNTDIVVEAARYLTTGLSGIATLIGAFTYGLTVSVMGACLIIGVLVGCGIFFERWQHQALDLFEEMGASSAAFLSCVKDLVDGFTELKIHRPKRDDFFANHLLVLAARNRRARQLMEGLHANGLAFVATYALLPMGTVVYILPRLLDVSAQQVVSLVAVAFFCLGPAMSFVSFISLSSRAWMTIAALIEFEKQLDALRDGEGGAAPTPPTFERIEIPSGTFSYSEGFALHLEHFALRRGELT